MTDDTEGTPDVPAPSGRQEIKAAGARSLSADGSRVEELFALAMRTWPPQQPQAPDISSVLKPQHVDESLKLTDRVNERFFADRRHRRRTWAWLGGGVVILFAVVMLVLVFTGNAELVQYLIEELVPVATGVIGGSGGLALIINWNKLRE